MHSCTCCNCQNKKDTLILRPTLRIFFERSMRSNYLHIVLRVVIVKVKNIHNITTDNIGLLCLLRQVSYPQYAGYMPSIITTRRRWCYIHSYTAANIGDNCYQFVQFFYLKSVPKIKIKVYVTVYIYKRWPILATIVTNLYNFSI